MKYWNVLEKRILYSSPWINLRLDRVQLPDGNVIDHHVLDYPYKAVSILPVREDGQILLIKNYRFITDTEAWELPAGRTEAGESLEKAAERELLEETGYVAKTLTYLGYYYPSNGSSNQEFHIFATSDLAQRTESFDTNEILELQWFSQEEVKGLILKNDIVDGLCLTTLFLGQLRGFVCL